MGICARIEDHPVGDRRPRDEEDVDPRPILNPSLTGRVVPEGLHNWDARRSPRRSDARDYHENHGQDRHDDDRRRVRTTTSYRGAVGVLNGLTKASKRRLRPTPARRPTIAAIAPPSAASTSRSPTSWRGVAPRVFRTASSRLLSAWPRSTPIAPR